MSECIHTIKQTKIILRWVAHLKFGKYLVKITKNPTSPIFKVIFNV